MTLHGIEFVRRFALHILPPGFTKIRHYGLLGNNRRSHDVPAARAALERSPWRVDLAPVKTLPASQAQPPQCPSCQSDALACVGRLDACGRFHSLRLGARLVRLQAGEPPPFCDSS